MNVATVLVPVPQDSDEWLVLNALLARTSVWSGDASEGGISTGALAGALRYRPMTPERQRMNDVLTALRTRGLVHFEFDRVLDREARWWATTRGRAAMGADGLG